MKIRFRILHKALHGLVHVNDVEFGVGQHNIVAGIIQRLFDPRVFRSGLPLLMYTIAQLVAHGRHAGKNTGQFFTIGLHIYVQIVIRDGADNMNQVTGVCAELLQYTA